MCAHRRPLMSGRRVPRRGRFDGPPRALQPATQLVDESVQAMTPGLQEIGRALQRWLQRRRKGATPSSPRLLRRRALSLARRLGASQACVQHLTPAWLARWQRRQLSVPRQPPSVSVCKPETSPSPISVVEVKTEPEEWANLVTGFHPDAAYVLFHVRLEWSSLPDRSFPEEPERSVSLLMAADASGRHRTRVLVIGKEWRPSCMEHVDLASQPVVYAGGGRGVPTAELFRWWVRTELAPGALSLHPSGALLLTPTSHCGRFTRDEESSINGVTVRACLGSTTAHNRVAAEFRARYTTLLLRQAAIEDCHTLHTFLSQISLKDVFPIIHRSWLSVRCDTFISHGEAEVTSATVIESLHLELQWTCHDLGLEVSDEDLHRWARGQESPVPNSSVITDPPITSTSTDTTPPVIGPREASKCLDTALQWIESLPVDPNLVLAIRDLSTMAKQA